MIPGATEVADGGEGLSGIALKAGTADHMRITGGRARGILSRHRVIVMLFVKVIYPLKDISCHIEQAVWAATGRVVVYAVRVA